MSRNFLLRLLGWHAIGVQGDILFVERLNWVHRRLRPGPVRTLDAGCGGGALTILAARAGNQALGLTFSAADSALAAGRARILSATGAAFEILDLRELTGAIPRLGTFDQILACEVIEHLLDDAGLIANLAMLLKPGGQLLLTTPYAHHHPVYREQEHVSGIEDGRHVRYGYTHDDLRRHFERAGLTVTESGFLNGYFAQKVFSLYLRLGRIHPKLGWLLTLPLRPFRWFDHVVFKLSRYPYMSVTAVAIKESGPRQS